MKLFKKEKRKNICYATYEKICPCCGRKFRATYKADDMYAYQTAKDMVNSNLKAHSLFCTNTEISCKIA